MNTLEPPLQAATKRSDYLVIPLCQAGLLSVAGVVAWLTHLPLLFASLGPTIFELVERPHVKSARPYSIIVGHGIGVAAGFMALLLTHSGRVPPVTGITAVTLPRVLAAAVAAMLTVLLTLLLRAAQPAAISTALVIALGSMQRWRDAPIIMLSIVLMTALGEPLRRWRYHDAVRAEQAG